MSDLYKTFYYKEIEKTEKFKGDLDVDIASDYNKKIKKLRNEIKAAENAIESLKTLKIEQQELGLNSNFGNRLLVHATTFDKMLSTIKNEYILQKKKELVHDTSKFNNIMKNNSGWDPENLNILTKQQKEASSWLASIGKHTTFFDTEHITLSILNNRESLIQSTPFSNSCKSLMSQISKWRTDGKLRDNKTSRQDNLNYHLVVNTWNSFLKPFLSTNFPKIKMTWSNAIKTKELKNILNDKTIPYFWWSEEPTGSELTNVRGLLFYMIREVYAPMLHNIRVLLDSDETKDNEFHFPPSSLANEKGYKSLKKLLFFITYILIFRGESFDERITVDSLFFDFLKEKNFDNNKNEQFNLKLENFLNDFYYPENVVHEKDTAKKDIILLNLLKKKYNKTQEKKTLEYQNIFIKGKENWLDLFFPDEKQTEARNNINDFIKKHPNNFLLFIDRSKDIKRGFFNNILFKKKEINFDNKMPEDFNFNPVNTNYTENEIEYYEIISHSDGKERFDFLFDIMENEVAEYSGDFVTLHLLPLYFILQHWKQHNIKTTKVIGHIAQLQTRSMVNPGTLQISLKRNKPFIITQHKQNIEKFLNDPWLFSYIKNTKSNIQDILLYISKMTTKYNEKSFFENLLIKLIALKTTESKRLQVLFRHFHRYNHAVYANIEPRLGNLLAYSKRDDDNNIDTPLVQRYYTSRLEKVIPDSLLKMRSWNKLATFDEFVMNITDFYSKIATPLTVLFQIFLYTRDIEARKKQKPQNQRTERFINKINIIDEFFVKDEIYTKGCPILYKTKLTNEKKTYPSKFINNIDMEKWKETVHFGYVEKYNDNNTYDIKIPTQEKTNYTLNPKTLEWSKFVSFKKVEGVTPYVGKHSEVLQFYNTFDYPLAYPMRYATALIKDM